MRLAPFLILFVFAFVSCVDNDKPVVVDGGGKDTTNETGGDRPLFLGKPPVLINEIYSANVDYTDEFGGNPGWVELYNPADTAVSLSGYYLTNSLNRKLWVFGGAVVEPRGYLTVFLSGRNKPDLEPPRDSIDLIRGAAGAWSWADNQNTPPGRSTAEHTFTGVSIGGTIRLADNTVGTNALGWSSAEVVLKLADWGDTAVIDMSAANQILFHGYVGKGSKLEIRLVQTGTDLHRSWPAVITGTGVENDCYGVTLPSGGDFPDLRHINALRFSNTANFLGSIDFVFNSIVARRRGSGPHASFELSKGGGKLFLMDSSWNIRDSIAYPAEVRGLSYARNFESGAWALSKPPTPNAVNSTEYYTGGQVRPPSSSSVPASGHYANALAFTLPSPGDGVTLCCDTGGRFPAKESALKSGAALNLTKTTVMRCAQFKDGAYPSDAVTRTYIIGERLPGLPVVSITVDPYSMFDSTDGLYAAGPNAAAAPPHYGANYWQEDELPVHIDFFESGARHAWNSGAGLRIFGNYSRSNAKKSVLITFREEYGQKNLRYALFPEHPNLTKFKHFILRNNGNNFPYDYIRDMLMTSLTEGLGMDYQKGRAAIVYYNGKYFGIHNLRERSNGDYFETNYNIDEEYIDLVRAGGEVSSGSDADYQDIVRRLEGVTPLDDNNLQELERRIDVGDFTNHHQFRIYYNDRDWPGNNMKRWRVNSPPSKWKWFMYDTDHGFGSFGIYEQPNIGMLTFATAANGRNWPNPPHSTFMLRKLLENEGYKNAFINRFSLLIATYFAPARVGARIDALMGAVASEVPLDQARWNHDAAEMSSQLSVIRNFAQTRPTEMQNEIRTFFGLGSPFDLTVSAAAGGSVYIHGLRLPGGSAAFKAYPTVPVAITAIPDAGMKFEGWSDGAAEAERAVSVTKTAALEARFGPASF